MNERSGGFSVGIAVMAKASAPGRTKTRLVPHLTPERAADLNTAFLRDIAENLLAAGRLSPVQGYMAYGPPGSEAFFEAILPPGIGLIESWIGPFGECLLAATEAQLARGHAAACVLNADSPTLPTAYLVALATELEKPGDRAVLGPSDDGGYYVLGLKAAHRRMFEDIDWSTERVAEQTRERAREIGLPLHELPTWYDVDDVATLARLRDELEGLGSGVARHTRALLVAADGSAESAAVEEATFTADQTAAATTALRMALGLPPEQFPVSRFVSMISDEIEGLRQAGIGDAEIAAIVRESTGGQLTAEDIARDYIQTDARG